MIIEAPIIFFWNSSCLLGGTSLLGRNSWLLTQEHAPWKNYSSEEMPFLWTFGIVPQVQYIVMEDALKLSPILFFKKEEKNPTYY